MDIQPLNGILNGIGSSGEWDQQRQLQRLIDQWKAIVGSTVAQHSRPLDVQNGILQVATSTAVWAQNLSFERRRILKKLNQRSAFQGLGLKEIRFSTAQWHNRPGSAGAITVDKRLHSYQQQLQWQQHPSRLPPLANAVVQGDRPATSAEQAFNRWSQRRQQQVKQAPPCPQCQTPAPPGELQRWGICAFCMAQQWQAAKVASQPDGSLETESWPEETPEPSPPAEAIHASRSAQHQSKASELEQTTAPNRGNANKTMFEKLQRKLSLESPQPQAPQKLKPQTNQSFASPQQLQPRTGFPPAQWPKADDPASFKSPSTLEKQLPAEGDPASPPNQVTPEPSQQATWAAGFQSLRSQAEQRQMQQADLEQRTAAKLRQLNQARELNPLGSQPPGQISQPVDEPVAQAKITQPTKSSTLESGHAKPVLKQKRRIPPQT